MDVQKEILRLRRELEYHNKLYYVLDAPVISDYEYDMLMQMQHNIMDCGCNCVLDALTGNMNSCPAEMQEAGTRPRKSRFRAFPRSLPLEGKVGERSEPG